MKTVFPGRARGRSWGTLAALGVLVVAAASLAAAASGARKAPVTVVIKSATAWDSMDAYQDAGRASPWAIMSPAYDRLVSRSPDGQKYGPYLATSWTQKAKSVTFTLRRDATCTDGHKLTAVDVLNSVKRFLDVPKRTGSAAVTTVGGWGTAPKHLRASNKNATFTFTSEKPWRNLLGLFANFPIICPQGLAAAKADPHALEQAMYGSGPYTLVSSKIADEAVFKLRPEWKWGPPGTTTKTMPDTLIYKVNSNNTTAANQLLTGELTYGNIEGPDVDRLLAAPNLQRKRVKNELIGYLGFNQLPGRPFRDDAGGKPLRQAIFTAVDREKVNQSWLDGKGVIATSMIREGSECYDPTTAKMFPTPSVTAAKKVLTDAGFTYSGNRLIGKDGKQIRLRLVVSQVMNAFPDYLNQVLIDLGFDVDYQNLPATTYGTQIVASNFDVGVFRGSRLLPDAGEQINVYTGDSPPKGSNYSANGVEDAEFNRLVLAGYQNPGEGGCKYFRLVQQRALKNYYGMPLVGVNQDYFGPKNITFPYGSTDGSAFQAYYIKVTK